MDLPKIQSLVEEFISRLGLTHSGIEVVTDVDVHPILFVRSSDSHTLIGPRGEHLRALNFILKQTVHKSAGEDAPRFIVDVNGYHTRRLRELRRDAETMAERVRLFRSPVEMSPMSAYERMIIHNAFAEDPEISTESEGEGKFRRIVLKYVSKTKEDNSSIV